MIMIIIIIITIIVRVTVHSPGWPGTGSMKQASSPQSQEPCPLCLPGIKGMYHKVQLQIVFKWAKIKIQYWLFSRWQLEHVFLGFLLLS